METPSISQLLGQASLSVTTILEHGMHSFQQQNYGEGRALFSLASRYLSPELARLSTLLDVVTQECMRYTDLQQELQTLGSQYAQVSQELTSCSAILLALESQLLSEVKNAVNVPVSRKLFNDPSYAASGLYAVCLGPFELRRNGVPITLCLNRNGQAILRYLIAQAGYRANADTLHGLFWPEDPEETASHKLHIAISMLRQSLQDPQAPHQKHILYKQGTYYLDPKLSWNSDVDEFLMFYNTGRKLHGMAACPCYEKASRLYTQPFLLEDLFADWSFLHRKHLSQIFEEVCHRLTSLYMEDQNYELAASWALKILAANNCNEVAYRLLMSIYTLEGKRHEALQLYFRCQQVLRDEMNVSPLPETEMLYQAILHDNLQAPFSEVVRSSAMKQ